MKIDSLAPSNNVVLIGGQILRVWRGVAEGRDVTVLVARVIVTDSDGRPRRFTEYDDAPVRVETGFKLAVVP